MKFFRKMKDGGAESTVTGYWLIEWKSFFSIALLKFEGRSREAFHNHAFDAISWVLQGRLTETFCEPGYPVRTHRPSWRPIITTRHDFHKVDSDGTTWVLTFRGPWASRWDEYLEDERRRRTLTHGRKEVPAQ